MPDRARFIAIWYFIGLLLIAYGVLITGAGIYELFVPPERHVVMAELRASIWWGALLLILGGFYVYHFSPNKKK